jgi:hypothetical protein
MRVAVAAKVVFLIACSSRQQAEPPEPTPAPVGDPAPSASAAGWRTVAARARAGSELVAAAEQALTRVDAGRRAEIEAALRRAGALAESSAAVGRDPEWAGSGTAPWTQAVHSGSMAVLAGMTATLAQAGGDAAALMETIDTMPMPARFNSGGREDDRPHRDVLAAEARR